MPANYRQAFKEFVEQKRVVVQSNVEESGPEHQRLYHFTWFIKQTPYDTMWTTVPGELATSKKQAEESASEKALKILEVWYRRAYV
ncbi:hypothetical protein FRC20_009840 [Serendipita sp. 405]|nr:hypothetical protein FRC20_009840 [Serendipita sp. 405]